MKAGRRGLCGALIGLMLAMVVGMAGGAGPCQAVTAINAYANIRREPWVGNNVIGRLERGETACVVGMPGGWYELEGGGYVSASVAVFVTAIPASSLATLAVTPTRLVTNTPTPTATMTPEGGWPPIASPIASVGDGGWLWLYVDVDGGGNLETVFRCKDPCAMRVER